jgi:cytochrome c peroxidase
VKVTLSLAVLAALGLLGGCMAASSPSARPSTFGQPPAFTPDELELLRALWIGSLPPPPADPSNRYADDPAAASLGESFFFDARFSVNGQVSCSSCHQPELAFTDGLARGRGIGETPRSTMSVLGAAYAPFLFWDGRKDSLWAQALGPLESSVEHGGTRAQYAHVVADAYAREYEQLFGALPNLSGVPRRAGPIADREAALAWNALGSAGRDDVTRVFVNIGKAIAAYERRIDFGASRFDKYVGAVTTGQSGQSILTEDEIAGLRLFIGRANCTQCHNGPLFTSNEFHNTGVRPRPELAIDHGRLTGATSVLRDEFNCRSRWSDGRERCSELEFIVTGEHTLERAYKVPSLRNVAERAPFMHAGQFASLADVLDHYNRAPVAPTGHSELRPLRLNALELRQLEAFLRTLSGPVVVNGPAPAKSTQ